MACDNLPTRDDLESLKENIPVIDEFVESGEETLVTPDGKEKMTISGIEKYGIDTIKAIEETAAKSYVGTWERGVTTFTTMNEYTEFNGVSYKPKSGIALPYVAQTDSPLNEPDVSNVEPFVMYDYGTIASGQAVKCRRGEQLDIDTFTGAIGEIVVNTTEEELVLNNGVTQGGIPIPKKRNTKLSFDTMNDAVINTSLKPGYSIDLKERASGSGSGGVWDVVLASTVTPNTFNVVQCTGVASLALVLREITPEAIGAKDDVEDDDTYNALQFICDNFSGVTLTPDKVYNLNGNTWNIPSGFKLNSTLSSVVKNGSLTASGVNYTDNYFGDITFINCDTRIGGSSGENNHCTGFKIGKIVTNEIFRLQYMNDFEIESIRVDIPVEKDSATQRAMGFTSLYEGHIGLIHMSGYYAMGFETAGNGSQLSEYASRNVTIDTIISDRNPAATSASGLHGVYLHGNYNLTVHSLYSVGYDIADQGVSNDFKFRDNWESKVNKVSCLTMQLASDANSTTLNSLRNNVLNDVNLSPYPDDPSIIGKATATISGAGLFNKNIINNFNGELGTSSTLNTDGDEAIKMTGNITYVKAGDLQLSNIVYESAKVKWADAVTYYYTRPIVASNTTFEDKVQIRADFETYNCRLKGGLRLETLGSHRALTHQNTVIEQDWDTILSSGTVDANISNTDILVDRPESTLRPNGQIRYRFVSFNNGYYLADDDDSNFVPFP